MASDLWLLRAVAKASLVVWSFSLTIVILLEFPITERKEAVIVIAALVLTLAVAVYWLFRKLKKRATRREAQAVAAAFALCAPIGVAVGLLLGELTGGYAELLFGTAFAPIGAFAGAFLITICLSYVACLAVLRTTRRIAALEPPDPQVPSC